MLFHWVTLVAQGVKFGVQKFFEIRTSALSDLNCSQSQNLKNHCESMAHLGDVDDQITRQSQQRVLVISVHSF